MTILKPLPEPKGFPHHPPPRIHFWRVGEEPSYRVAEAAPAKDDKPVVFYLGGIPVMSRMQEPEMEVRQELRSYYKNFDPKAFSLFIVTETSPTGMEKYYLQDHYNESPQSYHSCNSREFVDKALIPLIAQAETAEDVYRAFSRVNLVGHSYGTVFAQCVSNALTEALHERTTLTDDEINRAKSCISALNIAPICTVVEKPGDFRQLFVTATDDEVPPVKYLDLVQDDHPSLAHRRIGSSLLTVAKDMGATVLALSRLGGSLHDASQTEDGAHSLRIFMNTNHWARDHLFAFQVNPSAHIAREFMHDSLSTSIACHESGKPRNLDSVLDLLETEHLTDAAKERVADLLHRNKQDHTHRIIPGIAPLPDTEKPGDSVGGAILHDNRRLGI